MRSAGRPARILVTVGLVVVLYVAAIAVPAAMSRHAWHSSISIHGNGDFTTANGVIGGSGTPSDPFVIEGLGIDDQQGGMEIRDTDAHFVIRDVVVRRGVVIVGELLHTVGIRLSNVTHARLERVTVEGYHTGISLQGSSSVAIVESNLVSNGEALGILGSSSITTARNRVHSNEDGIHIDGLHIASSDIVVTGNRISSNAGVGLSLGALAANVSVHHNDFLDNGVAALASRPRHGVGGGNSWDAGWPGGGNFWSDYGGVDNCTRLSQFVCMMPDGIGDAPHVIGEGSRDRYPLMAPTAQIAPMELFMPVSPHAALVLLLPVPIAAAFGRRLGTRAPRR